MFLCRAKEMLCNNALYPDLYGHYREAKFTQTKHHWWWKANRVFNQLEVTRNHTGTVAAEERTLITYLLPSAVLLNFILKQIKTVQYFQNVCLFHFCNVHMPDTICTAV
jgi:hypothetical protein